MRSVTAKMSVLKIVEKRTEGSKIKKQEVTKVEEPSKERSIKSYKAELLQAVMVTGFPKGLSMRDLLACELAANSEGESRDDFSDGIFDALVSVTSKVGKE